MRFWRKREKPMVQPTLPTSPTRDAANVIADAVMVAKDQKIDEAMHQLDRAQIETRKRRVHLNVVIAAAHELHAAIREAGYEFEETAREIASNVNPKKK